MTQTATVTALPAAPGGPVELTVVRRSACGGMGFLLGLGAAVVWDRRMKRKASLPHRVTRKL